MGSACDVRVKQAELLIWEGLPRSYSLINFINTVIDFIGKALILRGIGWILVFINNR